MKYRCFILALIWTTTTVLTLPVLSGELTIAILDFENNSLLNANEYATLSKGLADIMISELSQVQSLTVVERRKLQSLVSEIQLSQAGVTNESASLQIGRLLGAKNLVFGSYMVTMDHKIRIDIRIVEVETGLTVKAEEVTGDTKQILKLMKGLSKKLLEDLDIKLTKIEIKQLKDSKKVNMEALIQFSKGLDAEDQGQFKEAKSCYLKALKIEPEFEQARTRMNGLNQ